MNHQSYFDTCREQSNIERNYKLSLESFKKELVYQAYCEIIDFLTYVHQQGYRRADGNPVNIYMDSPDKFKESALYRTKQNTGEHLIIDSEINAFIVNYGDNGIQVECINYNGTKNVFHSVESFIKRITKTILDTFVIVDTPKETSETSEWSQTHF